jgi:methionine synthase I (cobalamin-dependent)/5,10-methylenetetrahydrofolate reductase
MGRPEQFLEALKSRVLVGDGAMGTALQHAGVGHDECYEALNSKCRDVVRGVLESYVAAGADVIETNTFRANRVHLATFGLADKVFEFNYRGARLARSVAGRHVFVAGSVGPLGTAGPEAKDISDAKRVEMYVEQTAALAAGGVDLLLLETFTSLGEIRAAIRAAKKAAKGLPVLAQMAFYEGQGSLGGVSIGAAIEQLLAEGADGVGVNCGRGFADALAVVEKMAALTDVPISAYPNAGLPELRDGRFVYEQPVSYMADMAARMAEAGANLIGGCCGTDQRAVAAIAAKVRGRPVSARRRGVVEITPEPKAAAVVADDPRKRGFLAKLGKSPLVVVELDPPRGMLTDKVVEGAKQLRSAGVDLVSMAENPLASIRMGNVGMAYVIRRDAGVEPLVHFTGRDRNTLGLHSDLMGASALGIKHVLAITGDPAGSREGGATSVYDVNSVGLVRIIAALNAARTIHGVDTGRSTGFTVGVAFNPNFRTMTGQVKKLQQKVEAGAHFSLTQLVFDDDRIAQIQEATAPCGIPVLPGVMPLVSLKNALFVKNEVPGVTVPDSVVDQMKAAAPGDAARKVGLDIARRLLKSALKSGAPGAYIVAPFNRADLAAELVTFVREEWTA